MVKIISKLKIRTCEPASKFLKMDPLKNKNEAKSWRFKGGLGRFATIYPELQEKPLHHLLSIKNKNPEIMILGAGLGLDSYLFKKELLKKKINATMDVFSLNKIKESKFPLMERLLFRKKILKSIRNDYSNNDYFENISLYKDLPNKLIGKYDLVMASSSVGVFTNHREFNLFQSAILLKKGGKAFIEYGAVSAGWTFKNSVGFVDIDSSKIQKDLPLITKTINKLVNIYNEQNNTQLKFKISYLWDVERMCYFEIERIN
jgi:hypothetical protein